MFTTTYDVIMIFVSIAILLYSILYISRTGRENSKIWSKRLNIISIAMLIGFIIDFILNFFEVW